MKEYIVTIDDKGRVLIPSKVRELLNINRSTRLRMRIIRGRIVLEHVLPKVKKVRAGKAWGSEAFLDAGEATFGEY
jgi:AbrB family looped-hinge helix DNA binding protein